MKKLIEFKNLNILLNEKILYKDINFVLYEGDKYMLQGPNGCGKSLLLELIALGYSNDIKSRYKGLYVSGEILDSDGKNLLDPSVERKFSYLAQVEDFYNNSTILDEAISACNGAKVDFDEEELDELLEVFKLKDKKNKKISKNFSFGEGKIINIITRILKLKGTNGFFMDEPLNHLSFENSKRFNDIIRTKCENNPKMSIIIISHCVAIDFVNKILFYNTETKNFDIKEYKSYNCFKY